MKNLKDLGPLVRKVMKVTFCQMILISLLYGLSYAHSGRAQDLLQKKISLHAQNQKIADILQTISKTSSVRFMYSPELIGSERKISIKAENKQLDAVLDEILTPLNIEYEVFNRQILLKRTASANTPDNTSPERIRTNSLAVIKGTVTDEKGEPLPGVSILVKGSQRGAVTDTNGSWELSLSEGETDAVLVFSFVGYLPQEINVGNRQLIDVKLVPNSTELEELVVVGYGTMKKSSVTAAIAKVENRNLDQIPAGRAETALVGRLAGVNITNSRNTPGSAPTIRIRGAGSITASNDPLVVIDGFPGGSLANVNMNDVESIEVLKDASSAAIYGSRGAGGVIIVTTKKGKTGKPQLNFNTYVGVGHAIKHNDWISGQEYYDYQARYINRDYAWQGGDVTLPMDDIRRPDNMKVNSVIKEGDYIWEDILLNAAPIQNYNLSARGGTDNVSYYVSGTYKNEQGVLLNSWYKTYSLRANVDVKVNKYIKAGFMLNPNFNDRRTAPVSMEAIVKTAPFVSPTINPNGTYPRPLDYWGTNVSAQVSPFATLNGIKNTSSAFNNVGEMFVAVDLAKGLSLRSSLGGNITYSTAESFTAGYATTNNLNAGNATDSRSINLLNENVLNYNTTIGDAHVINVLGGASYQKATSRNAVLTALPGTFGNEIIETLNNATISQVASSTSKSVWGLASYFARLNYAYQDKYLLSASFRTDGSSRFGPQNRWGSFPSASVAWRISQEEFMKNADFISELKLRASYGVVGNFNIGDFRYLGSIGNAYYSPNGILTKGQAQTSFGNNSLRWERTQSKNFGFELGVLNNRISMNIDYYIKRTNDLLYDVSIPATSGFSNTIVNIGDIENQGIELELNTRNFTGEFRWETAFNISKNNNKVKSLGGIDEVINTHTRGMAWLLRVGQPMFSYYGYKLKGVLMNEEDVQNNPIISGSKPGNTKYEDINGDGKIDPNDRIILGSYLPKVVMGMVNDFAWKNFDMSVVMQSSLGAKMYNLENLYYQGATVSAMRRSLVENQWWSEAEPGDGKSPATALSQLAYVSNSDFYLEDASFVAVRNIILGYTLKPEILNKIKINNVRVYASVSNALMLTKKGFNGYNPEGFTSGEINGISSMPGFNNGAEPINRVYALGLNLNF